MLEARCLDCGATFTPADETDLIHIDADGSECGGDGVLLGEAGVPRDIAQVDEDLDVADAYLEMRLQWVGVRVARLKDDRIMVRWTDYVANEWTEEHDTLDQALARAALLAFVARNDTRMFTTDRAGFTAAWTTFADSQLTPGR